MPTSPATITIRTKDLAWATFVARTILGFIVLFSGASRFQLGFDPYARAVGAIPYAESVLPFWALPVLGIVIPCAEILLGTMLLVGLRTRAALVALGGLTVLVMAGYGVATLIDTNFGPTGQSGAFLAAYPSTRSWPLLFLLLLPRAADRYSVDALVGSSSLGVSDETARAWAILVARVLVGLAFFIGGINKVFIMGAVEHARRLFIVPYSATWIGHPPLGSQWSLWALGTTIPYLELVFPALLIVGLWTRPALYVLGGILSLVTFGHLVANPMLMGIINGLILPRTIWLLVVLVLPREADMFSIDGLLRRGRRVREPAAAVTG